MRAASYRFSDRESTFVTPISKTSWHAGSGGEEGSLPAQQPRSAGSETDDARRQDGTGAPENFLHKAFSACCSNREPYGAQLTSH